LAFLLQKGTASSYDVFVWLKYYSEEGTKMEFNFKKFSIASIIAISLILLLSGSGLYFGSIAKAGDDNRILAEGAFTAMIDPFSFTFTPVHNKCLLEVEGVLIFTGTIEGEAPGTTRALVFATCDDAAANPPGTFIDVFRSELEFDGTMNGIATIAEITYQGITKVGGNIKGRMIVFNGLKGMLKVDALVAVGGSYKGFIKVEDDNDD
jgi:hypothetical protein